MPVFASKRLILWSNNVSSTTRAVCFLVKPQYCSVTMGFIYVHSLQESQIFKEVILYTFLDSQVYGDNILQQFEKLPSHRLAHELSGRIHIHHHRHHPKHQTFPASNETKELIVSLKSSSSNVCFCILCQIRVPCPVFISLLP